jgi:hypothetical protein
MPYGSFPGRAARGYGFARRTFDTSNTAGTYQGFGYIGIEPNSYFATGAPNQMEMGKYSLTSSTGATSGVLSGITNLANCHADTLVGAPAVVAADCQYRTVACAIRIRYIGKQEDLGGRMYAYQAQADGQNLFSTMTTDDVIGNINSVRMPISRKWQTINWFPKDEQDLDFKATSSGDAQLIIVAVAPDPAVSASFEVEVINFFESKGTASAPGEQVPAQPVQAKAVNSFRSKHWYQTYLSDAQWALGVAKELIESGPSVVGYAEETGTRLLTNALKTALGLTAKRHTAVPTLGL